ncbi:helix-turn-helix transcriptional regulator [Staphylococcus epidermidis]|jgi:hypothetical protein|uniref:helix-turn-helix transcriptional regulator n=1 Tax=Staphylococcus epidermidis TaxID=1282 RepID=UPI000366B56D|nr:helix-turn-helix transcriptional regulator [Staphylococcus epidermidis]MBM6357232.1 helix-turn-helix transcriptional regulator [Staphylococcus epidermidis]MCA0116312.1 helix-turn-helix transcriptional regulator [Staphylococcus epidermidis]MCG1637147.1 helix-turn-helix transcriptional regulator [Staphylococcus epidermidis]MCG1650687.1 helix-turn-helix transcriptional regulator [Staphylococcus epidermidis]MCO6230092.1 helix-turn-helix transcriptional regulator [Staphylococcus epidermidis]
MTVLINSNALKKAMFLKGLNLSDLVIKTKVSTTYLSQIINGKKIPSPKLAKKIANVLDLNIEDLFEFEEQEA